MIPPSYDVQFKRSKTWWNGAMYVTLMFDARHQLQNKKLTTFPSGAVQWLANVIGREPPGPVEK
jgi:hypothetical protein